MNERWVEAKMGLDLHAKCDLLGIRVMSYMGSKMSALSPHYSVRKGTPIITPSARIIINNLLSKKSDGTKEVAIFRSVEDAIKGATSKKFFFHE